MSRNLGHTNCQQCAGAVQLVERPRSITPTDARGYFDEYEGMLVANAECCDCGAKYLAWVDERPRKHAPTMFGVDVRSGPGLRGAPVDAAFFDLSYRSTFDDEPGPDDQPTARKVKAERYYILDARNIVGNCALWWRVDGAGYTDDLDQAWLLDETRAKREARRPTDKLVPESLARKHAHTHVRLDSLRADVDIRLGEGR